MAHFSSFKGGCASELPQPLVGQDLHPPSAVRALLLPCFPHSIWRSHGSSRSHLGRSSCCIPSSLQLLTPTPRVSKSPARWDMDPACWHLRESPQLLLHQGSDPGAVWGVGERRQFFYYCWECLVWQLAASLPQEAL